MDDVAARDLRSAPLARLRTLELRYDGPLPRQALAELDAAPAALMARRIMADSALIDRLSRDAVRARAMAALAAARAAGLKLRTGG